MALKIDQINQQIISILQKDCLTNPKQLASLLHITLTPLRKRIKKLQALGYLSYYVEIDKSKFPNSVTANMGISLNDHSDATFNLFEKEISNFDCITNIQRVSGNMDYQLYFLFKDKIEKEDFLLNIIGRISGIRQFECVDVLKETQQRRFRML
jgi:DNA-binding Lrp family transcriptional regulator